MKVLGLDPGWQTAGYAVLEDERLLALGSLDLSTPHLKLTADDVRLNRLRAELVYFDLNQWLAEWDFQVLALERTDWHQNRATMTGVKFKQERDAQKMLGWWEGVVEAWLYHHGTLELALVDVSLWHREFGASTKEGVKEQCALRYPAHFRYDRQLAKLWSVELEKNVPDHVADAVGIATVALVARQLEARLQERKQP